ncbi:uncharacterized protein LOC124885752 [Capsicum annuum]|uniref:uncharacterized protein LOC124885752 n=1 Tax=Capsicum annuum TaxID=4072 RepID=UPI001FB14E22|nr:uncharacterized protein LOC124885752 [Capsicum annuum]
MQMDLLTKILLSGKVKKVKAVGSRERVYADAEEEANYVNNQEEISVFSVVDGYYEDEPEVSREEQLVAKSLAAVLMNFDREGIKEYEETVCALSGLDEEEKMRLWECLDEMVRVISNNENIFIRGDFNGHIGSFLRGYNNVHGGYGSGRRNDDGVELLDFAQAF